MNDDHESRDRLVPEILSDDSKLSEAIATISGLPEPEPVTLQLTKQLAKACEEASAAEEFLKDCHIDGLRRQAAKAYGHLVNAAKELESAKNKKPGDLIYKAISLQRELSSCIAKVVEFKREAAAFRHEETKKTCALFHKRAMVQLGSLSLFPLERACQVIQKDLEPSKVHVKQAYGTAVDNRDVDVCRGIITATPHNELAQVLADLAPAIKDLVDLFASIGKQGLDLQSSAPAKQFKELQTYQDELGCFVATIATLDLLVNKVMTATNGKSRSAFLWEHTSSSKDLKWTTAANVQGLAQRILEVSWCQ